MEVDAPPPPPRPTGARIGPEDFVAEEALPHILELIEESSRREAELVTKWKREAELQELLIDAISSSDDLWPLSMPPPPTGNCRVARDAASASIISGVEQILVIDMR
jgi:hypothetical protein